MMKLPLELRDQVVIQVDEYLQEAADSTDAEKLARKVIEAIEGAAEDFDFTEAEDIIGHLESSGDLDSSLRDLLTEHLEGEDIEEIGAEEIMAMVEKACEIEWLDEDEMDELNFGAGEADEEVDEL